MSLFYTEPTNRAERRAQMKEQQREAQERAAWIVRRDEKKQAVVKHIARNGITPEDLEKEYKRGRDDATARIGEFQLKMFYCGFALAMKHEFGFGRKRIEKALHSAEQIMLEELTTVDIIERVLDETGLKMRFTGEKGDELFYGL